MIIKARIYLIFLLLILVTGVSTLMITRTISVNTIKNEISHRLVSTAQSRAHHIQTVLHEYKHITKTLASGDPFIDVVNPDKNYTRSFKQVNIRIRSVIQSHEEISRIRVLDKNGKVVASSHADVGFDVSDREIFLKGKDDLYIGDVHFSRFTGNPVMSITAPIIVNGESSGFIIVNFDAKELFEIMADRTGLGKTGEIYLVNKNGYMITPSRFIDDTVLKYKVATENVRHCFEDIERFGEQKHEREAMLFKNYLDTDVLGVHAHIPEMNWCLLAEIGKEEAFAPVTKLTHSILLIIVALLAFSAILLSFISKKITEPIVRLHHGIEEIEKGNLDYKVGTEAKDEIGQLSRAFDNMTVKLKEYREELETRNISLEKKVKERTIQLEQQVREIERQKTEITGIARGLEKTNKDLEVENTERKRVEKELRESEARFRTVISASKDAVITIGEDGYISIFNPAAESIFGWSEKEMLGQPLDRIMPQEYRQHHREYVRGYFSCGEPHGAIGKTVELPAVRRDGTQFPVELSLSEGCCTDKRFVMAVIRDITRRKRAEEKLKLFSHSVESSVDGVAMGDTNGRITYMNETFIKMFGYSREELMGKEIVFIYAEDQIPMLKKALKATMEGGWTGELVGKRKNGELFPVAISASRVVDDEGNVIAQMAYHRDITKGKQMEEALKASEEKFRRVIETSPVAIWSQSADQTETYVMSPAMEKITGYTPDEFIKNPKMWHSILHQDDKEKYFQHLTKLLDDKESQAFELQVTHKDGLVRIVSIFISPGFDDHGNIVRMDGVVMDITEKKMLENQIAQSEKMAAIGILAAGVAHEFNNLLGGIMGNLSFAQSFPDNIDTSRKSIDESMKATEQATELVQSLLSYSRREDVIRAEVRILEILDDIIRLVGEELKIKGIKLDKNFQKVPEIKGSPSQLQQVFLNILINAIHAVGEDGVISINAWSDDNKIFIKFSDNGVGIKKENISKIFDPFYSTKGVWGDNGVKGTGLGLSISYNIIKAHNGDIMFESKPGAGTDVRVMIPIGTADKSTRENLKFVNKFNALIVEFEQKQAEMLAEIIRKLGGRPVLCNWCDEAIKKINQLEFDYAILDTNHPAMAGFVRIIDFIKSNKPSLPVILTCQGPVKYQYKEYARMASGIITKPFTFDDVGDILMELQQHRAETATDKV